MNLVRLTFIYLCATWCVSCGGGGGSSSDSRASACTAIGLPDKAYVVTSPERIPANSKIINGVTCGNLDRSSVVRILLYNTVSESITGLCTGSMISPTKVITAEHCVVDVDTGERNTRIVIAYGDIDTPLVVGAKKIHHSPGYSLVGDRTVNDVAIVELNTAVTLPPLPLLISDTVTSGEDASIFGYGVTEAGPDDESLGSELVSGPTQVDSVTEDLIYVVYNGEGANSCNGDSGGPLILTRNGASVIAGVVSQGSSEECTKGDTTSYTKLSSPTIRAWLRQAASGADLR